MEIHHTSHRPLGQDWLDQVFRAKSVSRGGVIRRKRRDVEREIGAPLFEAEVRRRGFHLLVTRRDYIVICQSEPVSLLF